MLGKRKRRNFAKEEQRQKQRCTGNAYKEKNGQNCITGKRFLFSDIVKS